jgi:hypothetical protein
MVAPTTATKLREILNDAEGREPIIEVVHDHVTRMLVTAYCPRSDIRALPRTERVPLEGSEDLACDVWLSVETDADQMFVVATCYGLRLWKEYEARKYRGDICLTRGQQLSAERRALLNL